MKRILGTASIITFLLLLNGLNLLAEDGKKDSVVEHFILIGLSHIKAYDYVEPGVKTGYFSTMHSSINRLSIGYLLNYKTSNSSKAIACFNFGYSEYNFKKISNSYSGYSFRTDDYKIKNFQTSAKFGLEFTIYKNFNFALGPIINLNINKLNGIQRINFVPTQFNKFSYDIAMGVFFGVNAIVNPKNKHKVRLGIDINPYLKQYDEVSDNLFMSVGVSL